MSKRLLKNIIFWLNINHCERIKTYGVFTHLKYVFNFNVSGIVIHLQADLSELPSLKYPAGYYVREMNTKNQKDVAAWIKIINEAYPDASENEKTFHKLLHSHLFLEDVEIFFITKNEMPIGTFTAGRYRKNPEIGGDARIAVLPTERGKGLGLFAIDYAFNYLKNQGITQGETAITLKREQSIILHMKCGFKPQFERDKVMFDIQKRMWPARIIARRKLNRIYNDYLKS